MKRGRTADSYIAEQEPWAKEKLIILRRVALEHGLKETIKWGSPVYVHKGNVLGIRAFKNWVAAWFFQGVYLADKSNVLVSGGDNTKGLRQWRFMPKDEVPLDMFKSYLREAILNDEKGARIEPAKANRPVVIPHELKEVLDARAELAGLFYAFSPSHQREYCEYIAEAKREETRIRRVQKTIDLLLKNNSLNDKYK